MGMDVIGNNTRSKVGKYFRNNVWWWHPLWDYCCEVAPEITSEVEYGHTNDGDGLDDDSSKELARILEDEITSGRTLAYENAYKLAKESVADEPCSLCQGTGKRTDMEVEDGCNACQGKGTVRPFHTNYPFSVENVQNFAKFLKKCKGFKIC